MLSTTALIATTTGETFSGTLIRYRSWGRWLTLKNATLKEAPVDGLLRIPKANVSYLQAVTE